MNKTTFSHYGSIIAVVIILAIMVAFATPFGDYVADSSNQLISSFTGKSNASLSEANSRDYKFRPLLVSRIVSATNQSGDPLTYDALDMNSASLRSGLVAFTSGSVNELNVNNAQLLDVTVEGEYTSATISFDVSDLAREGDEIGVYHYNESTSSWEHIGNYIANSEREITATFASLSPVALINLTKDYTVVETPDDPQPEEPEQITDLTGTKWKINSIDAPTGYGQFNTEIILNGEPYASDGNLYIGFACDDIGRVRIFADNVLIFSILHNLSVGDVIEFTGGADVTNPRLIAWVKESATQIQSQSNLITFYIETTECHAEAGMTWGEYVNSEYCTAEYLFDLNAFGGAGEDTSPLGIGCFGSGGADPVALQVPTIIHTSWNYLTYNGGHRTNDAVCAGDEIQPNHVYIIVSQGSMD